MPVMDVRAGSILILDDEPANVSYLTRLLDRRGYTSVRGTTSARDALARLLEQPADLLILDLHMPDVDGFAVLADLQSIPGGADLPVLVLTGDGSREARNRALSSGAKDFLAKPFDSDEAVLRIHNLLLTRLLNKELGRQNEVLEQRVEQRTRELAQAQVEILSRLARVAEYYDEETAEHTRRVASISAGIALALGLDPSTAELIGNASLLHDVGKIAVPSDIVRQPGRLTDEQWTLMTRHTVEGARMLAGSRFELLRQAEEIARTHHERWDGTGYPRQLRGQEIPLSGRIVAAADIYDALISERPYKQAWTHAQALAEVRRISGTHLDPAIVAALEDVLAHGNRNGNGHGIPLEREPRAEPEQREIFA